ncbi:hypothetical protein EOL70_03325 [Leucothrix sargassi]|nr:hypothetical protein EOL70_03325 [Leucothrix sargassi]
MKIIAADIGNDHAALSLLKVSIDGTRDVLFQRSYTPQNFSTARLLFEHFLNDADATSALIERLCISVAEKVEGNQCMLEALNWQIDAQKIAQHFYISEVSIISDFDAAARGISSTEDKDIITLNEGVTRERGIRVVTGAGHGLGMTWMDHRQNAFNNRDSEGGHVDFAPTNKEQIELLEYLMKRFNHVSYERILSNEGLKELYAFCKRKNPAHTNHLTIKEIIEKASTEEAAQKAIELFATTYGAYVGNLALLYQPMGGIYVCGRVAAELQHWMQSSQFLNACLRKGRMSHIVQQTPIYLVTSSVINLQGAVATATYH